MTDTVSIYDELSRVAKLFYQLKIEVGIQQFANVAAMLMSALQQNQASAEDLQHVQLILNECMTAYQNKEYILMADLIQYELAQLFAA